MIYSCTFSLPSRTFRISPWHVTAVVTIFYIAVVLFLQGGDPMALVQVGTRFDPGDPKGTMGYDGQFAWQIARSPVEGWQYVDQPAYRYQRILYPMLGRILAFGQPAFIPWVFPLLNVLGVVIGTLITEKILSDLGVSRWYALVYGLNIGILMAVRLDLNEPLAFMFFQMGVLSAARDQWVKSGLAFSLAILSKEVILVLLAGYAVFLAVKIPWRTGVKWALITFTPFGVLQLILYLRFGKFGFASGGALSTPFELIPLKGWWTLATYDLNWFLIFSLLLVPMTIFPAILGLIASINELRKNISHPSALVLFFQSGLIFFLPSSNILDPLGVSRLTIGLIVGWLNFGAYKQSRRMLLYTQLWIASIIFLIGDSFLPFS